MPAENPANVRTFELAITGMTCSACAARIEKTLNRLPGVHANVNFATEKAHAAVADDVGIDVLLETVRKAGFEAREFNAVNNEALAVERVASDQHELRQFCIAAVLTAPLLAQMGAMFSGEHGDLLPRWLQMTLATPVQFWIGRRFYTGAWHALRGGAASTPSTSSTATAPASSALLPAYDLFQPGVFGPGDATTEDPSLAKVKADESKGFPFLSVLLLGGGAFLAYRVVRGKKGAQTVKAA